MQDEAFQFIEEEKFREALRCIDTAIELDPDLEDLLSVDKAYIFELWGKFEEALEINKKIDNEVGIIRLLKRLGRTEEAKIYEEKLRERRTRYPIF